MGFYGQTIRLYVLDVDWLEDRVQTLEIEKSKSESRSTQYWNNWYSTDLLYAETKRELDELKEEYDILKYRYDNKLNQ